MLVMKSVVNKKQIIIFLIIINMLTLINVKRTAASELEDISKYTGSAVITLQDIMKGQYDNVIENIKKEISDKGYDYTLTMETARENGNPYKNMDYVGIISTYAAIKSYLAENSIDKEKNLSDISFLSYTLSENVFREARAEKVIEYEEAENGLYQKSAYHYTTRPETVPVFEELPNGYFKKTDRTEKITPKREDTVYYSVSFNATRPDELFSVFGVEKSEVEDRIRAIRDTIEKKTSNEELRQSVFLEFPSASANTLTWNEALKENIEYLEDNEITDDGSVVTAVASSLQGKVPYEYGGKPKEEGYDTSWWTFNPADGLQKGLDCSGFVQWTYKTAGFDNDTVEKLQSTNSILSSDMQEIDKNELQPGDIGVIERPTVNHCGIYAGNDEWYHCSSDKNTVVKTDYPFTRFFRPNDAISEVDFDKYTKFYDQPKTDDNEIMLISKLVTHEAENQGLNGWIAVAEVIKNRINSPLFPNTAREVIFQKGQFQGMTEKKMAGIQPREELINAVRAVFSGQMSILNNNDALYFRNPKITSGLSASTPANWGKHQYLKAVGQHAFYIQ